MYENYLVDFLKGTKCEGFQHQLTSTALNLEVKLRSRFPWENREEASRQFLPAARLGPGEAGLSRKRHIWLSPEHRQRSKITEGWNHPGRR